MLGLNYKLQELEEQGKSIKTGIVGAGQMGMGMVSQMTLMKGMTPAIVIDINLDNSKKDNSVSWEYILPLAPSTVSWEDKRLKQPYKMIVTAYNGNRSETYIVDDIDITGNVYDLIYIQPAN